MRRQTRRGDFRDSSNFVQDPDSGLLVPRGEIVQGRKILEASVGPLFFAPTGPVDPFFASVFVLWLANEGVGAVIPIDRSANAFTMQRLGGAEIGSNAVAGPFGGLVWRFPGGGGLEVLYPSFNWGSLTNYTHEAWMYTDAGSNLTLAALGPGTIYYAQKLGATTFVGDGAVNTIAAAMTFPDTTWQHIAVVKEGTSYSLYLHGTRIATSTIALSVGSFTSLIIGSRNGTSALNGYVGSFRCTHNIARYSGATYTVPTAQFPIQ